MVDEQHRDLVAVAQLGQPVRQLQRLVRIEARRRLVKEQELGSHAQRPRDLHPPLQPYREVARQDIGVAQQVETVQHRPRPLVGGALRHQ